MSYRGIIVDNSLEDTSLLTAVKTVTAKKMASDSGSPWYLRLVTISDKQLNDFLTMASDLIKPGWYMHLYNDRYLIVVFKDQVFRLPIKDKRSWRKAIDYGQRLGIKTEQLDFWPHEPRQEQTWLTSN